MKRFLSSILAFGILTTGLPALAAVRNLCQAQKAELKEVSKDEKEYSLCLFGEAMVGADTLSKAQEKKSIPEALVAFKKGQTTKLAGGVCGSFGASLLEAQDSTGTNYNLCEFSDGSLIEETTLWLGPDSIIGEKLNRILAKFNET